MFGKKEKQEMPTESESEKARRQVAEKLALGNYEWEGMLSRIEKLETKIKQMECGHPESRMEYIGYGLGHLKCGECGKNMDGILSYGGYKLRIAKAKKAEAEAEIERLEPKPAESKTFNELFAELIISEYGKDVLTEDEKSEFVNKIRWIAEGGKND